MSQNTPPDTMDKDNLTIKSINPIDDGAFTEPIVRNDAWFTFKTPLIWKNLFCMIGLHLIALYGVLTWRQYKLLTLLWGVFLFFVGGLGVTAGAHRLWTHRTYKANLQLRIILMTMYLFGFQYSMFDWVRDHRIHHKYAESDADPHNSKRGFFFSHVGWLVMKRHPEALKRGRQIDMSDVLSDPVFQFSKKYFTALKFVITYALPAVIPVYLWNENWQQAIISQVFIRHALLLNAIWTVNSFAHLWGYRSYDKSIAPVENRWVAWVAWGEGWHNYHHVFPWDYKAAELGPYGRSLTTMFIDFFAKIGWAYDLKSASDDLVRKVAEKRGDGSHPIYSHVASETSHKKDH